MSTQYLIDSPAFAKISVFAILKDGSLVGKLLVSRTTQTLKIELYDWTGIRGVHQRGQASGTGYNKLKDAMFGKVFAGEALEADTSWEYQLQTRGFVVEQLV